MKAILITFLALCVSLSAGFCNGIGIVDGVNGVYLTVKETNTKVLVKDQIAITTTTQVLQNNTGQDVNFKFGYPINENSNPTSLRWLYNDIWSQAVVSSAEQDTSIPGGSGGGSSNDVQQALVDFLGDSPLFFSPINKVADGATIVVEVSYVELLPYFLGAVNYSRTNDISLMQPATVVSQTFEFALQSEKEILSVELDGLQYTTSASDNMTTINFSAEETVSDFDYNVSYELSSDALGVNSFSTMIPDTLFNCDSLGSGYFSMIIEPESNVDTEVIQKNFSLIIDRSGSMSGDKIIQAKDAASFIVQNLNFGDYFNIIDFSSDVRSFSSELVEYNLDTEENALAYIDNIQAGGSTNISESLITSINQFNVVQEDKANIIVFCTDGEATAGVSSTNGILSLVENEINSTEKDVFLFTIGIGESLDQALLTLLARENSGLVEFVTPQTLQDDMEKLFLSINNPVLLNTNITFSPDIVDEIYPYPYPNLYKGQQLILSGRYKQAETIQVSLSGKAFNVPVSYDFEVSLSDTTNNNLSFLPKLWAKQKLDALGLDFYLVDDFQQQDSITALIDSLSACYGIIAVDFSSFDDGGNTTEVDEITRLDDSDRIRFQPNPFTDRIQLDLNDLTNSTGKAQVVIYDTDARIVLRTNASIINGFITLDNLQSMKTGVYFIHIWVNDKQYIIKMVK